MSLSGVHQQLFDISEGLVRSELLLDRQHILGVVKRVDDILITTSYSEEWPCVGHDDERQAVVQHVEQILSFDLSHMHIRVARTVLLNYTHHHQKTVACHLSQRQFELEVPTHLK